jgi:ABC-type Fe3+-hydroxamate transport system substrate-binding protein
MSQRFRRDNQSCKRSKALNDSLKSDLKSLENALKGTTKRSVFLDLGSLYSSSKMDFLGNLFSLINADNIALNFEYSSPQLSAETVIEKNPDVYICTMPQSDFIRPDGFDQIKASKITKFISSIISIRLPIRFCGRARALLKD